MNFIKETKKYKVYEVEFEDLGKIVVKDPKYYEDKFKVDRETCETIQFSIVKFESQENKNKSQCECFQADTLSYIKRDIKDIQNNKICSTNFYSNWMKIIFKVGNKYKLIMNGEKVEGIFKGQDTYKKNTFYFSIDGKNIKSKGLVYKEYTL